MSSFPDQSGSDQERPKSFSRFIRRASKVLHPKPLATTIESIPASPMMTSPMDVTPIPLAAGPPAPLASHPPVESVAPSSMNTNEAAGPIRIEIPRRQQPRDFKAHSTQQEEKAKLLFAKYGFSLEARDWTPSNRTGVGETTWVEKKVRVRIHRECHKCKTSFGNSKVCISCDHVRCKSCPRWPPVAIKKDATATVSSTTTTVAPSTRAPEVKATVTAVAPASGSFETSASESEKENVALSGSNSPGTFSLLTVDSVEQNELERERHLTKVHQRRGADVVYRPPHHRVRRKCHKCDTLFNGRATDCENCGHQRCPNCPRDPTKFSKYPEGLGYPGDVPEPELLYPALERVYRKPRHRIRFVCHECSATFLNSQEKTCASCKHERCAMCERQPVKRVQKTFSDETLRGLEGKLGGLRLLPQTGGV